MGNPTAPLSRDQREGHGDPTQSNQSVRKGTYRQVGSAVPLSDKAISPNSKSGSPSGGQV
jgi:hypothetical protein